MPTVSCPVEDFEHISITYPDTWQYRHKLQYMRGVSAADEGASWYEKNLLGTIALLDNIEGEDFEDVAGKPLHYGALFDWILEEVFPKYLKATQPPEKNS